MSSHVAELLRELIAIPSVNPMGRDVDDAIHFEHRVTDFLQATFDRLRIPWWRQPVADKRENIIARLDATTNPEGTAHPENAPVILWEVHQDTVPVDGMTIDPFRPPAEADRVRGRGACDVKGSMAAMVAALAELKNREQRPATILLACTVNEEHGYTGAKELIKLWGPAPDGTIFSRKPDAAIIAEPTELNVVIAHKGTARWRAVTHGKACHSSNPAAGINAVYLMATVLRAVQAYHDHLASRATEHRYCGRPTASVGIISGGLSVNTVPDRCSIDIDRRLIPDEQPEQARAEAMKFIDGFLRDNASVDPAARLLLDGALTYDEIYLAGEPLSDANNAQLAQSVNNHAAAVCKQSAIIGVPFGTDAAVIAASGVPSVVFGAGSIAQAHTCDEWVAVDQLDAAFDVLVRIGASGLD